jgi:hypothetical protein
MGHISTKEDEEYNTRGTFKFLFPSTYIRVIKSTRMTSAKYMVHSGQKINV